MPLDLTKLENKKQNGTKMTFGCPACMEEGADHKKDHLIIYSNKKFGCCVDQSKTHYQKILQLAGTGEASPSIEALEIVEQAPVVQKYDKKLLLKLLPDYSYWDKRGISREVIKKFDGGLAHSLQFRYYFTFPVYNKQMEIIGWVGRFVLPELPENKPKWLIKGPKGQFLWGWHVFKPHILEKRATVLLESVGDALACAEAGVWNLSVVFGTSLSEALAYHLISLCPEKIIIALNSDEAGQLATKKMMKKLGRFFNKNKIISVTPPKKDWGDCTKEEIVKCLN